MITQLSVILHIESVVLQLQNKKLFLQICFHNRVEEKSVLFTLADVLVLEKLRANLGFSCCEKFFSGAAPLGSDTVKFFLGLNIRLYEAYGMSESSGPHFMSGPNVYKQSR